MALHTLNIDAASKADEVLFWGKITGIKHDYYIAMTITYQGQFEFPYKKFYWCLSNDFSFREMPDLNDQHKEFIDQDSTFFLGEPNRRIKQQTEGEENAEEQQQEEPAEDGEDGDKKELDSNISEQEEIKVPHKELTEIDRLKYVVLAIENDC